ncbi:MAG: hypothetical protein ACI906_004845, partial [Candidatus Latescibacterota bacterium]
DDDMALVREKLAIFTERTAPLLAFYREQGARIIELEVGVNTLPDDLYSLISGRKKEGGNNECQSAF